MCIRLLNSKIESDLKMATYPSSGFNLNGIVVEKLYWANFLKIIFWKTLSLLKIVHALYVKIIHALYVSFSTFLTQKKRDKVFQKFFVLRKLK